MHNWPPWGDPLRVSPSDAASSATAGEARRPGRRPGGLLGDGVDGVLEDVAFSAHMVGGSAFGRERNVFECADRLILILARLLGRSTRTSSAIRAMDWSVTNHALNP